MASNTIMTRRHPTVHCSLSNERKRRIRPILPRLPLILPELVVEAKNKRKDRERRKRLGLGRRRAEKKKAKERAKERERDERGRFVKLEEDESEGGGGDWTRREMEMAAGILANARPLPDHERERWLGEFQQRAREELDLLREFGLRN
jgi:hypothetical protein